MDKPAPARSASVELGHAHRTHAAACGGDPACGLARETLCGLGRGYLTRRRLGGRNAAVLQYVEACPSDHPLRGRVIQIAAAAAEIYGAEFGARYLRLMNPDAALLPYYTDSFGFRVAYKGAVARYCEREILR